MHTTIRSGIPTTYRTTRFRSRLEARWAAFFDLIGWRWTYEPFDADGWIPDFLIHGSRPLVIEVGPCSTIREYEVKAEKGVRALGDLGSADDFLVLGVNPVAGITNDRSHLVAGLFDEGYWRIPPVDAQGVVETGEFGPLTTADCGWAVWGTCLDPGCERIVVAHETNSYDSRPCGYAGHSGGRPAPIGWQQLDKLWAAAGNEVQWHPSGRR